MRKDTGPTAFLSLFITYLLVKVMHHLIGFEYDLFSEGLLNMKFIIDIASWGIVYAAVYFLLRKLLPRKGATTD
ncbi:hypothetical protein A3841_14825 [Pontibacter flavimaris]|uniref:Uncharacterized protein n=1 Tax=Pontibacter flavimaris TaxID=1797110 RepID=A0A1Q5PFV1_9BACT|nr:hypothetical protein A3841_14825 [Pontibacter flavimaris]